VPLKARLEIAGYVALYLAAGVGLMAGVTHAGAGTAALVVLALALAALAALLVDAFYPKSNLFGPAVVRLPTEEGARAVALTFDDGPVAPYTAEILDILDRYRVKATFFCIGENVRRHPELAGEIVRRGHTIGNHTDGHRTLLLAGSGTTIRELDAAQAAVRAACGVKPAYFRCPKGYKNPFVVRALRRRGLTLVGYGYPIWDVQNPPPRELVDRVLGRVARGDIILMHDGFPAGKPGRRDSLVAALPRIIEGIRAKGLTPVSLDEALGRSGRTQGRSAAASSNTS
jgi:peptidoglycan/xylan/chitin deacetylase (PgdA/CDA1 family)